MELPLIKPEQATMEQSKILTSAQSSFGFLPNLIKKMVNAPVVAEAYLSLNALFEQSSFTKVEQQLILLTVSRYHECEYCMAANSAKASMSGVTNEVIQAIRNDDSLQDPKLAALHAITNDIIINRGNPNKIRVEAFLAVGYQPAQLLEILLGISMKVLSNYFNHIVETPLDDMLMSQHWSLTK